MLERAPVTRTQPVALLLLLAGWICSLVPAAVAVKEHGWMVEFNPYSWTGSTLDATLCALVACLLATIALCLSAPLAQFACGIMAGLALVVKASMLHAERTGVTLSTFGPWLVAVSALVQLRARRRAQRRKLD